MAKIGPRSAARSTIAAGAAEVREKLKSDLSRWSRVRRFATLKPTMGCITCDMTGKVLCDTCDGTGRSKLVFDDRQEACATCEGTGRVTCVTCAGRGIVPNVHRKKVLWLLILGGLAWGYVLFRLWNRDILPEFRAQGGGRQISRPVSGGRSLTPGATGQPLGATGTNAPPVGSGVMTPGGQ